ncbi:E3 ubiquitin-protein ligase E3D [Coemansia asiatica]|nr:E3 ubiquitin-protein ligase E3D [Coemansia asiatica]
MSAFYIEILDSLQVVDIYAKYSQQCSPASQTDTVRLQSDTVVFIDKHTSVDLPVSVNAGLSTKTQLEQIRSADDGSEWVRLRAPISSASKKARLENTPQLITGIKRTVTVSSLLGLSDICCRACKTQLVSEAFTGRADPLSIRDLPSAYWIELVDCWVCHPEEDDLTVNKELLFDFESDKTATAPQSLYSSSSAAAALNAVSSTSVDVWVGDSFALISAGLIKDLPTRLVHIEDKKRFDNAYTELRCTECDHIIGESGRMGTRRMQKLYMHYVDFQVSNIQIEHVSVSFSQVFCSELLGHISAHAVYKFVVEERQSCRPVALIHVVGWNAELHASRLISESASKAKNLTSLSSDKKPFSKYVKVLFAITGDSTFDSMAKEWLSTDSTELVSLLEEDCKALARELDLHSSLLPPQLRMIGNMKRSFLRM